MDLVRFVIETVMKQHTWEYHLPDFTFGTLFDLII